MADYKSVIGGISEQQKSAQEQKQKAQKAMTQLEKKMPIRQQALIRKKMVKDPRFRNIYQWRSAQKG